VIGRARHSAYESKIMHEHPNIEAQLTAENEELRRRIAALEEGERRFRKYFHQGLIGMAAVSLEHGWLEINDRLCEILGYPKEELLQKNWMELTHPDDLDVAVQHFRRLVSGEVDHYTLDKRYIRKDGSPVYTTIAVQAFYRENGTVDCVVGLMEDITERKRAEEALQQQHRTLKHLLQSSDHERQLIAYDIHDGLAQQLAGAILQFQIYEHAKDTNPDQATKAFHGGLALLRQGHSEARRIISGVRPPILDESGVVAAVAHLVHDPSVAQGPKIEFYSRAEFDRLPSILENAIYRIVQEGLVNARKHSASPKVRISLVQRGDRVRIEIRDWGIGFDPKTVKKNRFGLAGIRERARLLGGKCRIRTAPGAGTSLVVELPLLPRELRE
jgi:PAS domain S-box-containing protein